MRHGVVFVAIFCVTEVSRLVNKVGKEQKPGVRKMGLRLLFYK